jgi:hypothetical protein
MPICDLFHNTAVYLQWHIAFLNNFKNCQQSEQLEDCRLNVHRTRLSSTFRTDYCAQPTSCMIKRPERETLAESRGGVKSSKDLPFRPIQTTTGHDPRTVRMWV